MEQTRKRKNETRRKFTITNTILSPNNGKNEKTDSSTFVEYNAEETPNEDKNNSTDGLPDR